MTSVQSMTGGIKAMNHILIHSRTDKENSNRMREMQFREYSADTE